MILYTMPKKCFTKTRANDTAKGKKGTKYQGCADTTKPKKKIKFKVKAKAEDKPKAKPKAEEKPKKKIKFKVKAKPAPAPKRKGPDASKLMEAKSKLKKKEAPKTERKKTYREKLHRDGVDSQKRNLETHLKRTPAEYAKAIYPAGQSGFDSWTDRYGKVELTNDPIYTKDKMIAQYHNRTETYRSRLEEERRGVRDAINHPELNIPKPKGPLTDKYHDIAREMGMTKGNLKRPKTKAEHVNTKYSSTYRPILMEDLRHRGNIGDAEIAYKDASAKFKGDNKKLTKKDLSSKLGPSGFKKSDTKGDMLDKYALSQPNIAKLRKGHHDAIDKFLAFHNKQRQRGNELYQGEPEW